MRRHACSHRHRDLRQEGIAAGNGRLGLHRDQQKLGTLYTGVTSDLSKRAWEHRASVADGFTKRYALKRLVFAEFHDDIRLAIQREKNIKHWPRDWKIGLIEAGNPGWDDLYDRLLE